MVDPKRTKSPVTLFPFKGVNVDAVVDHKNLGVHIDNKLDWACNTEAIYKKDQSHQLSKETQVIQLLPDYAKNVL